jgi:hypothetical protein
MKRFYIFVSVFFIGGLFSLNALDMIILRDGNIIDAKVLEINPTEIRYKRADNLNGPTIVIMRDTVLSIRYENGVLDIINPATSSPSTGQGTGQADGAGSSNVQQLGTQTPLQIILNALPAIPIAGNTLKFQFGGDNWIATVNGENFSTGTIELETTGDGVMLILKQTHIWPGTAGKTAGRLANMVPGGGAVGSVLDTAGSIAGAVAGAVEASGPVIVLEYKAGPPAKLTYERRASERRTREDRADSDNQTPAENKFDLDGINVFAISLNGVAGSEFGAGVTLTVFEGYKPNVFFTPSFFLSVKGLYSLFSGSSKSDSPVGSNVSVISVGSVDLGDVYKTVFPAISAGVLFKHRFPRDRVLWNVGASLDFMFFNCSADGEFDYTYQEYYGTNNGYITRTGTAKGSASYYTQGLPFLFGMGIQTGFSFRLSRIFSIDLNGFAKFPFGEVEMERQSGGSFGNANVAPTESFWPFTWGGELALTFWIPYRSGR